MKTKAKLCMNYVLTAKRRPADGTEEKSALMMVIVDRMNIGFCANDKLVTSLSIFGSYNCMFCSFFLAHSVCTMSMSYQLNRLKFVTCDYQLPAAIMVTVNSAVIVILVVECISYMMFYCIFSSTQVVFILGVGTASS